MASDTPQREYVDSPEERREKISKLIDLVKASNHTVVFTGAGISTSAGVPDYRGDGGLYQNRRPLVAIGLAEQRQLEFTPPTAAHHILSQLVQLGIVQHIATSNHDGLHDRAGTPSDMISDVFGNVYVEKCLQCSRHFRRHTVTPLLGRRCEVCGQGKLVKTGTRMGAETPRVPLERATTQARRADLAIVLGSSLTVSPFCHLPFLARQTVVVTRQDTSYDDQCHLCIHADCDDVISAIGDAMGVRTGPDLPHYRYTQDLVLTVTSVAHPGPGTMETTTSPCQAWDIVVNTPYDNEGVTCLASINAAVITVNGDTSDIDLARGRDGVWRARVSLNLPAQPAHPRLYLTMVPADGLGPCLHAPAVSTAATTPSTSTPGLTLTMDLPCTQDSSPALCRAATFSCILQRHKGTGRVGHSQPGVTFQQQESWCTE